MAAAKTGVIYLLRDRFQLYSPFLRQIVEFRFSPDMVLDLDVLNGDLLQEQVKVFVTNGKIAPSNLIFVLNDSSYFVKDFSMIAQTPPAAQKPGQTAPPPATISMKDLQPQIDMFVEHVPYENVVSQTFPLKNGLRVCAVNQDLFKTVQRAFESLGFTVELIIPGMVLGGGLSAKPVLDGVLTSTTLQKAPALKQFDMKSQDAFSPTPKKQDEQIDEVAEELENSKEPPKTNKKRLVAMLGVLVSLLVVLVIVFVQSQQPPTPPQQPVLASQPTVIPSMPPTTATQPTQAITSAQTQNLTVQIVNTSATAGDAQTVRTAMNKYTFKSVTTESQTNVGVSNTVVSFSGNTPQSVRNTVLDEIRKVKSDLTVQESQSGSIDITIIIGK